MDLVRKVFNKEVNGVVSNQVLGEFCNVLLKEGGNLEEYAAHAVFDITASSAWLKQDYSSGTVTGALALSRGTGIPF